MSRTIQDFWPKFTAEVQLPGNVSQDEATDLLQVDAPILTDQEGDDWYVAIATYYASVDIITQPTYVQLRNHVNNNEAGANTLFAGLNEAMQGLPESVVVEAAFRLEDDARLLALIPGWITVIEGQRDAVTEQLNKDAYTEAITFLQAAELRLTP